jgi:predicted NBD/HSP70 family sugar kinase
MTLDTTANGSPAGGALRPEVVSGDLTGHLLCDLAEVAKEPSVTLAPATTRDLRRSNRAALLRALLFGGPTSRPALARATGLSAATVGLVVSELLEEGLVVEGGSEESGGGRPRAILRVPAARALSVGVDLGERGLRVEAFDLAWRRRADAFVDLDARATDPVTVAERIAGAVRDVVHDAALPDAAVLGVGVSVPGVVERTADSEIHAASFGWDGVPLGRLLRRAIDAAVLVDNGAKALGQAELWFGAGRGAANAIVALLGIGVGAAVFTEGRLYRGSRSSAGEWGHTPIVVDGEPCRCGSAGCLEAYVGESAILRRWDAARGVGPAEAGPDTRRLEALFERAGADPVAASVTAGVARHLGAGLATLINLFNPERIVLAGSVGLRITPPVLEVVRQHARRYSLRQPFESVEIVQGQLGDDAVALGAASLVVDDLLARGFPMARTTQDLPVLVGSLP